MTRRTSSGATTTSRRPSELAAIAGRRAPKVLHYKGKTREGTKISFIVKNGWLDQLDTLLPTNCITAQGGTPKISFTCQLGTNGWGNYILYECLGTANFPLTGR